jgi:hypothetical protein
MTSITASTSAGGGALDRPASVFASILSTAVTIAVAKLEQKVAGWIDKIQGSAEDEASSGLAELAEEGLDDLSEGAGAAQNAGIEAAKAGLHGDNPITAAIRGAWQAGTPALRAAIVTAAVAALLLLLLSPVLLIIYLISLLIITLAYQARGHARRGNKPEADAEHEDEDEAEQQNEHEDADAHDAAES